MTEIVSHRFTLSDSTFKTRPDSKVFYVTDASAGPNAIQAYNRYKQARQMKLPKFRGRSDIDSFQKPESVGFIKFNDSGDHSSAPPYRDYDNLIDPISGFLSAGGDIDRRTGQSKIKSFIQISDKPNNRTPQSIHSIRKGMPAAPPETLREKEGEPPGLPHNDRLMLPVHTRAVLGGWTSKEDTTPEMPRACFLATTQSRSKTAPEMSTRDKLAINYVYTSTTQKAYNDIPYDQNLLPKRFPPTTTLESCADPVRQQAFSQVYERPSQEWQRRGTTWDWHQLRPDNFNKKRPYTYCAPNKRAQQIPLYSGCIGAKNIDEIDNPHEPFKPYAIKRNVIPNYKPIGAAPDIPGYTGCRLRVHSQAQPPNGAATAASVPQQTTALVHQALPVNPNTSIHRHDAPMSKMVTTVAPHNPFNKKELTEAVLK